MNTTSNQASASPASASPLANPWIQLIIGVICMVMIANLQYGWTFFVPDIQKKFGWDRSFIQVAFTLFVLFETWLVPIEGWFVDKFGPRIVVFIGGVLCGIGWIMNSKADSLQMFYAAQIVAGIGAGGVYGTCIGNALKWFHDRRGLAAGITAAGFGAGSALTVIPIQNMIRDSGFQATFFNFGLAQGIIICILSFMMFTPPAGQVPVVVNKKEAVQQSRRQFAPSEIIGPYSWWIIGAIIALAVGLGLWAIGQTFYIPLALAILIFGYGGYVVWTKGQPVFTLMYLLFVLVGAGGLIVTANLAPIAGDLKVAKVNVTLFGLTMAALTFAATLDRILNGLTRPFFGWISDQIGRENTMFVAFFLEGCGIFALYMLGTDPVWFVVLSGLVFFAWGEIYSLFPSTCTDTFGTKFATTNSGLLYTAKGTAALLVPYASSIHKATGSWDSVFIIAAVLNIAAALLAVGVLKPWRRKVVAANDSTGAAAKAAA